jgi:hypothetical protein
MLQNAAAMIESATGILEVVDPNAAEEFEGEQCSGEKVEADEAQEDLQQSSSDSDISTSTQTSSGGAGLTAAVTLDMYWTYSSGDT